MSYFGGKWPLKWKFSQKSLRIHRQDTELRFVTKCGENRPLRSCCKVVWFTKQKNSRCAGLVPVPILAKMGDCCQNSLNVVTTWPVHVHWIWSGSSAFCRTYSRKIDFFGPKSWYNIGFEPTIITAYLICFVVVPLLLKSICLPDCVICKCYRIVFRSYVYLYLNNRQLQQTKRITLL